MFMKQKLHKITLFFVVALLALSTISMMPVYGQTISSSSGDTAPPGGTASVTVSAENVDEIRITGIPGDWTEKSHDTDGSSFASQISSQNRVRWVWASNQSTTDISVDLEINLTANIGTNQTLTVVALSGNTQTTTNIDIGIEGATTHNLEASVNNTSPGGKIQIKANATNVGGITIEEIPDNFTVAANTSNPQGIFVEFDPDNDGNNESAGWAWGSTVLKANTTLTLDVPVDAQIRAYNFNVTAKNGVNETTTITAMVQQETPAGIYDQNDNQQIDSNEVKQSIRCFLFDGNNCIGGQQITSTEIKTLIRIFLGFETFPGT